MATYISGRDLSVVLGGTALHCMGSIEDATELVEADTTGTGDKVEVSQPIRLRGGYNWECVSTDRALLAQKGAVTSFAILDDTTTVLSVTSATIDVKWTGDLNGVDKFKCSAKPQTLPSAYTAISNTI